MSIYEFEGKRPRIDATAFISPEATIIGDVIIGKGCYIAPGARLRGDWGTIIVGSYSNIQENCIIHAAPDDTVILGEKSHLGHGSILHGPELEDHVTVGMGAIVMDKVKIGAGSCIGAGSLVTSGTVVPARRLFVGVPAKDRGQINGEMEKYFEWGTKVYMELPPRCFKGLVPLELKDVVK